MIDEHRLLPCGTDIAELTRQVFDGVPAVDPEHQRRCPHCRRALRRIRAAAADVRGVAAEPVEVPDTLVASVMARIRMGPSLITVEVTDLGLTTVADHVVGELAREAALRTRGVHHASVIASETTGGGLCVRARLIVGYGPVLPVLAGQVREAIVSSLVAEIGARTHTVDIMIDDLA